MRISLRSVGQWDSNIRCQCERCLALPALLALLPVVEAAVSWRDGDYEEVTDRLLDAIDECERALAERETGRAAASPTPRPVRRRRAARHVMYTAAATCQPEPCPS